MSLPYPQPVNPASTRKMRANRRIDTKPEVKLRSALHRSGLRFRKDYPVKLPNGKVVRLDIAFTRKKLAVFVDGCFWHSCPDHGTTPKSNQAYWIPKLRENVQRDRAVDDGLADAGWRVLRVWEHEQPSAPAKAISDLLTQPLNPPTATLQ